MSPAFDPERAEYTVNVTHDVEEVTATWVENHEEATSEVDPDDSDADTDGHQLELGARGTDTGLTITVTAEDGTELEYTITVRRPEEPVTDDATLSNLTIGEGTLTPPFEPGITEYTVGVPYDIEEVTAEWDEAHDEARSEGDPADADTATSGHQVELGAKGTEITLTLTITVTAADGSTTEDYTVTVTRLLNDDATLSDLTVEPGTLDPAFSPGDTLYATNVEHDVEQVTVTWELSDTNATFAANLSDADANTDGHQVTLLGKGATTRLTITVTAENGDTTQAYRLAVARAEGPSSNDATLDDLTVAGHTLAPSFSSDLTSYSMDVTHDVDEVSVTFTTTDSDATTDPASSPHTFGLGDAGTDTTELDITVTASDGTTTKTYTITVTRAAAPAKNNDATLASLTLDGVDLNPGFDPAVDEYTAEVGPSVGTITVTWGTTDSNATTDPASSPHTFTLDEPGDRTDLTVTVTAEDGETTKKYNVEVKRAEATDDAHLDSLTLKLNDDNGTVVILAIDGDETDYTTDVPAAVDEVEVMWKTSDKYATTDRTSPHTLELDDPGETIDLDIIVTASDGDAERTYTLTVARASESINADLSSLELVGVELNRPFEDLHTDYTAEVAHDVDEVEVRWETSNEYATTDPASSPHTFALGDEGTDTPLEITVTAESGNSKTYTVTVTRMEKPVSDDATLSRLSVSPGVMDPTFDPGTKVYTAKVGPSVGEVDVMFATADGNATTDLTSPHTLELGDEGSETPLTITVTAEDGITTETYTVTVTRVAETDDATLGSLEVKLYDDDGTMVELKPAFDPATMTYRADVAHDVDSVEILWKTNDDYATTEPAASPYTLKTDPDLEDTESQTITVTASDGETKKIYTITVGRLLSDDATLSDLTVDPGMLAPDFDPVTTMYTTGVEHDVEQVTVTWAVSHQEKATSVAVPADADGQTDGHQLNLGDEGTGTDLTVTVTAEDGTEMDYTLKVTRAPSDDATLSSLSVSPGALDPNFDPATTAYTAGEVAHDVEKVVVTFTKADENATTDPAASPYTATLNEAGMNTDIEVTVTAEDGNTTETYTITVTRAEAPGFVFKRGGTVVSEFTIDEGDTAIYSVELATEPATGETVTVAIVEGDGIDITSPGSLTFTEADWDTPQKVEMSSTADAERGPGGPGGDHAYRVGRRPQLRYPGGHTGGHTDRDRHHGRDPILDGNRVRRGREQHVHHRAGFGADGRRCDRERRRNPARRDCERRKHGPADLHD